MTGFERVHVPAGETRTVWLYPSATDFATVDAAGDRRAAPGEYTVSFGVEEAAKYGMGFVHHTLRAA